MDEQFKLGPLHDLSTVNESGSLKFTCYLNLLIGPLQLSALRRQTLKTHPNK